MRKSVVIALVALTACQLAAQQVPRWPEVTTEMRPGSRWWWMGSAVDAENLKWNIGEYAKTGIGTLEITPIYGVKGNEKSELSYLSAGWFEALKTCQQAGSQNHVSIDMNGGTGWPFGGPTVKIAEAAGKLVTKNTTLTADGTKQLTFDVTPPEGNATLSKVMAYRQDADGVEDVTAMVSNKTLTWTAPEGQWLVIAIYNGHTLQQVKRAAPGGEGYVLDHYDADAVSHYLQHFDKQFEQYGAQWPQSFFNDSYEVYGADWTPRMFEQFEQRRGYKLEEHMDQLLSLGKRKDQDNQVLADYRQTLSDLLLDHFTRQWTQWAHGHGATTRNQSHGSPGNLLDFYGAVDIPETESFGISNFQISGLRQDEGFTAQNLSDLATLKYASSAAHVMGRQLTSSETFTWLAEHFRVSLSQMKPDMDFFFLSGVNHIFFHGTTYSPREAEWPGWKFYASIDMSPTNSIWRDAPSMMQYATRCQSFLQMGSPDNDLLVYAPFQDAMHKNTGSNQARLQLFDINTLSQKIPSIPTTVRNVEAAGLDCDYISDRQLAKVRIEDGMLVTEGGTRYKALIIPSGTTIEDALKTQVERLYPFVIMGESPALMAHFAKAEPMRTEQGLRCIRRQNDEGYHYFIANLTPRDVNDMLALAVPFGGATLYNPMTGDITPATIKDGKVQLNLRSGESIILKTSAQPSAPTVAQPKRTEVLPINGKWTLSFIEEAPKVGKTFTLDKPQTWEALSPETAITMGTGVYTTTFTLTKQQAQQQWSIDLGDVRESARVYINNKFIGCAWAVPFILDCKNALRAGKNTLRIEVTNLPANRIADMDRRGVEWRKMKEINVVDINYKRTKYDQWDPVPSGLNSDIKLIRR